MSFSCSSRSSLTLSNTGVAKSSSESNERILPCRRSRPTGGGDCALAEAIGLNGAFSQRDQLIEEWPLACTLLLSYSSGWCGTVLEEGLTFDVLPVLAQNPKTKNCFQTREQQLGALFRCSSCFEAEPITAISTTDNVKSGGQTRLRSSHISAIAWPKRDVPPSSFLLSSISESKGKRGSQRYTHTHRHHRHRRPSPSLSSQHSQRRSCRHVRIEKREDGAYKADGAQVHGRKGATQAAGHQGASSEGFETIQNAWESSAVRDHSGLGVSDVRESGGGAVRTRLW
eukprot:scaffold1817_cov250-Pinguiococcus_pyrenoidosus.AAC.6